MKTKGHMDVLLDVLNKLPDPERSEYSSLCSINLNRKDEKSYYHKKTLTSLPTSNFNFFDDLDFSSIQSEINEISLNPFIPPPVFPNKLFVSDIKTANDLGVLRKHQIYSILTLGTRNKPHVYPSIKGGYRCIGLDDSDPDLLKYMPMINKFISLQITKGNVLIHSFKGNNRSCCVVIGFLMKTFGFGFSQAEDIVKSSKPGCDIKNLYKNQLIGHRWKNYCIDS